MIRKALSKVRRSWVGRGGGAEQDPGQRPIEISAEEGSRAVFCFTGEFGYEMISWVPYLLFLKKKLGIRLRTMSRPGSSVFYGFSAEHREVAATEVGDVWGDPQVYRAIDQRVAPALLIHPGKDAVNRRHISVGGYLWTTRDIHARIEQTNYVLPDYSHVRDATPLRFDRPYVVINNKYFRQWHYDRPINFFSREDLVALRDTLHRHGYATVYNHFVEPTATDVHLRLDDRGIFDHGVNNYDLRDSYRAVGGAAERNRLQLSVFNGAAFVIGPQGGNLYLPAICRKDMFVLMRDGDYIDYQELGRLYGVRVEVFYEARHMVRWLEAELPLRLGVPVRPAFGLRAAG